MVNAVKTFSCNPVVPEMSDFKVNYEAVTTYQYNNDTTDFNGKMISTYKIPRQYRLKSFINMNLSTSISIYNLDNLLRSVYCHGIGDFSYLNWYLVDEYKLGYNPHLILRQFYNKNEKIIKTEEYTYTDTNERKEFSGLKTKQRTFFDFRHYQARVSESVYYVYNYVTNLFNYHEYKILTGSELLSSKVTTLCDLNGNNPIEQSETFQYDNKNRITQHQYSSSQNGNMLKELIYPQEGTALFNKNMISTITETKITNNGKEINKVKQFYPDNSILPAYSQSSFGGPLRTDIIYDKYDNKGHLLQYTTITNGLSSVYLWGYNQQYPIAEIENATYSEVTQYINETILNNIASKAELTPADSVTINNLRNQLPNAHVTTYTYNPLIGIRTMIDFCGVKTKYLYDHFGHLATIKDDNDKIIERHEYHYKNP